jgi:heterotetrameric sarcosine oxidase gamma subunit
MVEAIDRMMLLIVFHPNTEFYLASALSSMGVHLPRIGKFHEAGGLLIARLGPYQLLAMRSGGEKSEDGEIDARSLMEELAPLSAVAGLIDQSDTRIGIRVTGPDVAARLGRLLPLDLHPSRFTPGQCAQTLVAQLSLLVLQHGECDYELQCGRSHAGSFFSALEAAG